MDLTLDTIFKTRHNSSVLPLINTKLKKSLNEYETWSLESLLEAINYNKTVAEQQIPDNILDQVLARVDNYFESKYKTQPKSYLLCGLRDSIREHKLCYSISWCKKSEKYLSSVKRSVAVGAGPLMVSKSSERFKMMGSSPGIDWIHLFELEILGKEEYFYLEVPYKKENISKLKSILKCSTSELLKQVNQGKIIYTEPKAWNDSTPKFQEVADSLNNCGIYCKVEIRTRKKLLTQA